MPFENIFSKKNSNRKSKPVTLEKIIVDNRERNSLVPAELISLGFQIEYKQLPVADYIVKGIAIERKTLSDFKSSIINKRIVSQLLQIKQYKKAFLILEGFSEDELYSPPLHENALRGFLLSVALEYQIPIIFTLNSKDTAKYISVLAKKKKSSPGIRASRTLRTKKEQTQFILEGFPNIGPKKAKQLIESLGSLKNIFNATEEELTKILGSRTKDFKEMLD